MTRLQSIVPAIILASFGATPPMRLLAPPPPPPPSPLHISVKALDAPAGTIVRIRYLRGPDSLQGRSRDVATPVEFDVQVTELELFVQRTDRKGTVRVQVERRGSSEAYGIGQGTGERVRIHVWPDRITVRTVPWAVEL